MHRAGVLRAFRHRLLLRPVAKILCRLRLELHLAAGRAEIEALAFMPGKVLRGGTLDTHAADRIGGGNVVFRLGRELRTAALAAEMIAMAAMIGGRLAGGRIDSHAADRVANDCVGDGRSSFRRAATAMGVMVVVGMRQCGKASLSRTCNGGSASSDWKVKGQFCFSCRGARQTAGGKSGTQPPLHAIDDACGERVRPPHTQRRENAL